MGNSSASYEIVSDCKQQNILIRVISKDRLSLENAQEEG